MTRLFFCNAHTLKIKCILSYLYSIIYMYQPTNISILYIILIPINSTNYIAKGSNMNTKALQSAYRVIVNNLHFLLSLVHVTHKLQSKMSNCLNDVHDEMYQYQICIYTNFAYMRKSNMHPNKELIQLRFNYLEQKKHFCSVTAYLIFWLRCFR